MDYLLDGFTNSVNGFQVDHETFQNLSNGFKMNNEFLDPILVPNNPLLNNHCSSTSSSSPCSEGESPDSHDTSNSILKYISEMLMEEGDLEIKPCMLQNCLALQATERSLYDVLGQKYPPSPNASCPPPVCENDPTTDDPFSHSSDSYSNNNSFVVSNTNWVFDQVESKSFIGDDSLVESYFDTLLNTDSVSETQSESVGCFDKEVDESSKFLSRGGRQLTGDVAGKKTHVRGEDSESSSEEGRNSKHSAVYAEEYEPPEIFDKVLLCKAENQESMSCEIHEIRKSKRSNGKTNRNRKQPDSKKELVDLWTLLSQCAQAVSIYDQRTAKDLLNQIRQHSSPFGDGTQRLAHYFANGLETRLSAGTPVYVPFACNEASAAEILKAYQLFITACPFKRMSNFLANRTILKRAEKATRVHIIDFGILYGFQWPCLIQRLSVRPGGPPKLRITGIELPQPGFRPAERVEETGRRLENYCKRFNVPFEYKVLAQKWETVKLEDLGVDRDELTIVTCMYRLKHIPDETVIATSPRDTVLKLIKRINPGLVIHDVINGSYSAPFFLTRFREALFHFSALFDMFEATVTREDPQRLLFEKEIFGRDAINVIACEGLERVERPETYKQWQVRNIRAGFRQIPLDQEIIKRVKKMVRLEYHEDFVVDQDGHWMLQGWKGRIVDALSCWVPA